MHDDDKENGMVDGERTTPLSTKRRGCRAGRRIRGRRSVNSPKEVLVKQMLNVVVTPNGRAVTHGKKLYGNITKFHLEGAVYDVTRECYVGFMTVYGIPGDGWMSMGVEMSDDEPSNVFFGRGTTSRAEVPLEVKQKAHVIVALMNIQLRQFAGTLWVDRSTGNWCREMVLSHTDGELVHHGEDRVHVRYEIGPHA